MVTEEVKFHRALKMNKLFSVNHKGMDAQHSKLFDIINELIAVQELDIAEHNAAIEHVFPRLANYTIKHFKSEELLMKKLNAPRIAEHIKEHEELITKVKGLLVAIEKKKIPQARRPTPIRQMVALSAHHDLRPEIWKHIGDGQDAR